MVTSTGSPYVNPITTFLNELEALHDEEVIKSLQALQSKKKAVPVETAKWSFWNLFTPRAFSTAPVNTSDHPATTCSTPHESKNKRNSLTGKDIKEMEQFVKEEIYKTSQVLKKTLHSIDPSFEKEIFNCKGKFQTALHAAFYQMALEDKNNNQSKSKMADVERLKHLNELFIRYPNLGKAASSTSEKIYKTTIEVFADFKFYSFFLRQIDAVLKCDTAYKALREFAQGILNNIPIEAVYSIQKLLESIKHKKKSSSTITEETGKIVSEYFNEENDLNITEGQIAVVLKKYQEAVDTYERRKLKKKGEEEKLIKTAHANLESTLHPTDSFLSQQATNLSALEDLQDSEDLLITNESRSRSSCAIVNSVFPQIFKGSEEISQQLTAMTTISSQPLHSNRHSVEFGEVFTTVADSIKLNISQDTLHRFRLNEQQNPHLKALFKTKEILQLEVDFNAIS